MERLAASAIQLELKYCERCGGLGLRPKGSDLVLCTGCARATAGIFANPAAGASRAAGREAGFWSEGGQA